MGFSAVSTMALRSGPSRFANDKRHACPNTKTLPQPLNVQSITGPQALEREGRERGALHVIDAPGIN